MWRVMNPVRAVVLLVLASGGCLAAPTPVSVSQTLQQVAGGDWQTVSEAAPGEASRLRHQCRRISNAEAASKSPLPLILKPIAGNDPAWRGLGALEYRGQGVEIRSQDPRFASLMIEPGHVFPRLPTGDFIQIDPYVPLGPETETARCFAPWSPADLHPDADIALAPPSAIRDAVERHRPLQVVGAAPLSASRWVVLMGAERGSAGTVLVVADTDGTSSQLAELPFGFQVIQPVLDPHSARRWVRLAGRARRDEPFRVVVLDVPAGLLSQ